MKAAVVHDFDEHLAIEEVLDGTAEQPRLVFRLQPAAASGPEREGAAAA